MDENSTQKLHEVFTRFSDSPDGIDGSHFARLCRDLNLQLASRNNIEIASVTMFDLIFAKAKVRGQRRLDFNRFLIALDLVGQRLNLSIEDVISAVCTIPTLDQLTGKVDVEKRHSLKGPERFYYDVSTYTGTQARRRSIKKSDNEEKGNRVIDLKEIVNRDMNDKWTSLMCAKTPPSQSSRPLRQDNTPIHGPERFYYDRATYTGIHKHTPTRSMRTATEYDDTENAATPYSVPRNRKQAPSLPATAPSSTLITPSSPLDAASYINVIPVDTYFQSFMHPLQDGTYFTGQ